MVIGEKAVFAIECAVLPEKDSERLYGTMCYWVANFMIGDLREERYLYSLVPFLETVVANQGQRQARADLAGDDRAILTVVYDALFGPNDLETSDTELLERYVVTPNDETFDGFFGILVEQGDSERLLWRDDKDVFRSVDLANGEFCSVARLFVNWLESCLTPANADGLIAKALPDKQGRRWYSRDSNGDYFVYEREASGTIRYAFTVDAASATKNVPRDILKRFDDLE